MGRSSSRVDLVFGAVGSWDEAILEASRQNGSHGLIERHRSERSVLLSNFPVESYAPGHFMWHPLVHGPAPTSWRSASESRMAAGLVDVNSSATLHTCALGVQDVYVRAVGDAVYFANRLELLLDLVPERLHTNWRAWASTIALCSPYGTDTPFLEIERLGFASAVGVGDEGRRSLSYEPTYLGAQPLGGARGTSPLDLVLTIDSALRVRADEPLDITLSGGWDSRILVGLAHRRVGALLRSWTTSTDDGHDEDLEYARLVAGVLGTRHTEVVPPPDAWVLNARVGYLAFEHQTWLHTWFIPLAETVRERGGQVVDGVAGGVLLKSAFISHEVLEATDPGQRRAALFRSLTGGRAARVDIYTPAGLAWVEQAAREAFDSLTLRFEDHPSESSLHGLLGRTARSIAPSAYNLYGGPSRVLAPYLHPEVVEASLTVPEEVKARRVFNRQVIEVAAGRSVANLPSTNDARERGAPGPRRQTSREALKTVADAVMADPVAWSLLGDSFRATLVDEEKRLGLSRWTGPVQVLQALTLFADWRRTHGARLAEESPPWG